MPQNYPVNYLKAILNSRVYEAVKETPLELAGLLSDRLGSNIWLKREDTPPIFCYKIRGAYNKMVSLTAGELKRGVVAASAGNHAQGVAMSARQLGCEALIVMPVTTPSIKIEAVRRWGAKLKLIGDSYDEAFEYAQTVCRKQKRKFISAFDDPLIIAGQGTVGLEIIKQSSGPLDAVFVPVGGGGLISGIAVYIKQLRPEVKVIGVEPFESDALYQSLKAGKRIKLNRVGIFADGVAVKQIGKENFKICRDFVDDVVRVSTDEICAAIKDICEDTRTIVEPAGALGIAGIKRWLKDNEGKGPIKNQGKNQVKGRRRKNRNLVAIASGANMNFDRLRHVSERAEVGEKREAILAVTIPENRGSFRRFYRTLGRRNISEFNYRYASDAEAHIFVGVQIKHRDEIDELIKKLAAKGIASLDLTENELAKIHARYMVGGRVPEITNERIFSFEFPERPGALGKFLDQIGTTWNITLFHYRNHGSDFGRVLCGIQVPSQSRREFNNFLRQLGYAYREETNNPAYTLFLR
ncbi:threonine ammonia-lyase, biosynthetic [Candidatus Spongiihabitans sp.]|uniref:threonine ammonia-lyase, biosynthetic n=1 Tax=Candidatus Spongiihabitans sp. TaxID=3101308 RepID=UPI003C6F5D27